MKPTQFRQIACELRNNRPGVTRRAALLMVVGLIATTTLSAARQAPRAAADHQPPPAGDHAPEAAQGEHANTEHAAEEHGVFSGLLWPVVNFVILFGGLWWFFKEPFTAYLRDRHSAIRKDLVEAAHVKATAAAQLADLQAKLEALPGEIETLKQRGAAEIAAEEQRISAQAAAERDRLLEQTRREIDLQVRLAKRELLEHAANLSVQLAGERLQRQITPDDQNRLVDRYLDKVTDRRS